MTPDPDPDRRTHMRARINQIMMHTTLTLLSNQKHWFTVLFQTNGTELKSPIFDRSDIIIIIIIIIIMIIRVVNNTFWKYWQDQYQYLMKKVMRSAHLVEVAPYECFSNKVTIKSMIEIRNTSRRRDRASRGARYREGASPSPSD